MQKKAGRKWLSCCWKDTLQQSATDINSQQMQKLQQILSFTNWVTPRAQAMTDAHTLVCTLCLRWKVIQPCFESRIHRQNSMEWMVYPNPATNMLYIQSRSGQIEQMEIYGLDGRCVLSDNSNQEDNTLYWMSQLYLQVSICYIYTSSRHNVYKFLCKQ